MRIQYKQILAFIIIILISSLPVGFFILHKQEEEKLNLLIRRGMTDARILARSTLNVLLANGGSVAGTSLDAREMISIISPLEEDGLIYADSLLLSSKKEYNGLILASWPPSERGSRGLYPEGRVPPPELVILEKESSFSERFIEHFNDTCFEFTATGSLPGKAPICAARLYYSRSAALFSIYRLRQFILAVVGGGIVLVIFLGYIFSRIITRPVTDLIDGVEILGSGDLNYRIPVRGHDEFGRLAMTFNHFAYIVTLQIGELQKANRELRRLDELKDYFIANVSHELRTPLFGIIGLAQSLMERPECRADEEGHRDLALIEVSASRLANMINNILDFSQIKYGDVEIDARPMDVAPVVQLVVSILLPLARRKDLEIVNAVTSGEYTVYADSDKVQQVLFNLIGNAVKFTLAGEIRISAEAGEGEGGRKELTVTITDTGIGIPGESISKIFESFEQVQAEKRSNIPGSGLGLSITRDLVNLMEGSIGVKSDEGKGSSFYFTLPLTDEKPERSDQTLLTESAMLEAGEGLVKAINQGTREEKEPAGGSFGMNFSIMVVDDEPVILQVLRNYLELAGFSIITCTDGESAVAKIEEGVKPDIILLDIMLPGMSGYDVCRRVREFYSSFDLPVLMLTAKNRQGDLLTGFEAGANDYITKPVERKELLARVSSMISFKSSAKLASELEILNHDITMAHEIQQSVLIGTLPDIEGMELAVQYCPMTKLGGDYYDIRRLDDRRISILIADVSGHGVPAAFICAMLKVVYTFHLKNDYSPGMLMKKLNESMYDFTGDQYVTVLLAVIDMEAMTMTQAAGGHWPPLIARQGSEEILRPFTRGVPMGWVEDADYPTLTTSLEHGDRIVFYTDGIVEPRNSEGAMFTEQGIQELMKVKREMSPEDFTLALLKAVRKWCGITEEESFDDDVTLIVVDIE